VRDSNIIIIGFSVVVAGLILQTADFVMGGNTGTILQLAGTLSIIIGIPLLAIGFLMFIRKRSSSPMKS
jgi:hypothetical protein